jgi:hypothetical protein
MRAVRRPDLVRPRTISAPAGAAPAGYRPWIEVAAVVRVSVAGWGLDDTSWVHWAVPVSEGQPEPSSAVTFEPGRRAALPGKPSPELRRGEAALDETAAAGLCEALLARWRPRVHYDAALRLPSRLDEPLEAFRRRCLGLFGPVPGRREGCDRGGEEAERLAEAIESRALSGDELEVLLWRVGVGWYPTGVEPAPASADPL